MAKVSSENFRDILKNDEYAYVLTSKSTERIEMNFPNMPNWYKEEWNEWCYDVSPHADVICFEYKGLSNYKLLRNAGDPDRSFGTLFDGNFGAVFHGNKDKVLDILCSPNLKTTIQSLKAGDRKINDDLLVKLTPYLKFFEAVLHNNMELEYLVFKILVENGWFGDIGDIDRRLELKGEKG